MAQDKDKIIQEIILYFEQIYKKKCKTDGLKESEWSESEYFSMNDIIRILNKYKENKE